MTFELMVKMLEALGLPFSYFQFKDSPGSDCYVAYFETEKVQHYADNRTYKWDPRFAIELYSKEKDPSLEERLIDILGKYNVPWSGGESTWIEPEQMYQTVFYC